MTDTPSSPPASGGMGLGSIFPFFGGGAQNGVGNGIGGLLNGILGGGGGNKNKGAGQDAMSSLPSTKDVPTATTGFYQQSDPTARAALLSAMMNRAKQGTNPQPTPQPAGAGLTPMPPPAPAPAPAPAPQNNGGILGGLFPFFGGAR